MTDTLPDAIEVIWLDGNITTRSPSMQHLVASLGYFEANRISVNFICDSYAEGENARLLKKINVPKLASLGSLIFSLLCNTVHRPFIERAAATRILHATGSSGFGADLISIHFIPADWFRICVASKPTDWREWLKLPSYVIAGVLEFIQRKLNPEASYHVVSRNLADSLVRKGVQKSAITVIPTPYDHKHFSIEVRRKYRDAARTEFGFNENEIVFSFVSQGGYHRKGVMLAARTIHKLRKMGHPVRLMLIGGKGPAWERMQRSMSAAFDDCSEWLVITGFIPNLAYGLSASDAFIMPSLYEGFAAVEVEAAALGLPLFLTDHPGVEMILKEETNGWKIDFDPDKAAQKIASVIDKIKPADVAHVGEAITLSEWQQEMGALYFKVHAKKNP